MRFWQEYTVVNLLDAGKDAGWVAAMVLICVATFVVSSIFGKRAFRP